MSLFLYTKPCNGASFFIHQWAKESNINNPVTTEDYHITIIDLPYHIKNFQIIEKGLGFFQIDDMEIQFNSGLLALRLHSHDLENLFLEYSERYKFNFPYDRYKPHLTLSYQAKKFPKKVIKKFPFDMLERGIPRQQFLWGCPDLRGHQASKMIA